MLQVQVHFGEAGMQMWQVLQVVKNNIALSSMMAQQVPKIRIFIEGFLHAAPQK